MNLRRILLSSSLALLVASASPLGLVGPVFAQSGCTCLISAPTPGSALGSIWTVNGNVFKTGSSGLENATAGTEVKVGDVISTGASSSASVSLGRGCDLALRASAQVTIAPVDGGICVRLTEEFVDDQGVDPTLGLAVAGGLAAGTLLFVGLGQDDPASQ